MVKTRRQFLKTAGASTFAFGAVTGTAAGKPRNKEQTDTTTENGRSAEEAGINSDLKQLFNKQKFDQARKLLDENNVYYSSDKITFRRDFTPDDDSRDVSTDAIYTKGESEVYLIGWHKYGQVYRVRVDANLDATNGSPFDGEGPPDGYGISFSDARWETDGNYSGKDIKNAWGNPEGIIAKVDPSVSSAHPFKYYGHFAGDIEKRGYRRHNVFGHYGHTWSLFNAPVGVSFGIQFGVFSVSTTGGDSWVIRPPRIEI